MKSGQQVAEGQSKCRSMDEKMSKLRVRESFHSLRAVTNRRQELDGDVRV